MTSPLLMLLRGQTGIIGQVVDTANKTIAIIGDSLTDQDTTQSGNTLLSSSHGYMTIANALMGHRFNYPFANNLGVGGDSMAQIDARKTDLGALTEAPDVIVYRGGTNDVPAATTLASMQSDLDDFITYAFGTLAIERLVICTIPPRNDGTGSGGAAISAASQTKLDDMNDYIRGKASSTILINDTYDLFTDGATDNPDLDLLSDAVHFNPAGAYVEANSLKTLLEPLYGVRDISDLEGVELLSIDDMAGTAGGKSGVTGDVATGWLASGSGGSGTRTASKDGNDDQVLVASLSGGFSFNTLKCEIQTEITTGYAAGDRVYAYFLVKFNSSENMRGPWLTFKDKGSTTFQALAHNKATGSTGGFTNGGTGDTYLFRTPILTIDAGNTSLDLEVNTELDGTQPSGTCSANYTILNAGIRNIDG